MRQLQAIGHHFIPFFKAVENVLSSEGNSPFQILTIAMLRILLIGGVLAGVYAFGRILNSILGQEIVIEEEIIVEEEDEVEGEDATGGDAAPSARRGARDKKER